MSDTLTLYGFGLSDRSGKVRWLCHELGIAVDEQRIKPGDHRKPPYTDLNPYGMIPTVVWRGETLIESTAICTTIAEQYPDSGLVVAPGEPERATWLQWMATFAETFESRLVEHLLAKVGVLPEVFLATTGPALKHRLPVLLGRLPDAGFLVAGRFTLADIEAAYGLALAINAGLVERAAVDGYLAPLMKRPAAVAAGFFSSLED